MMIQASLLWRGDGEVANVVVAPGKVVAGKVVAGNVV
jgi:hypothetical protein